jgi:hypothetical protein
MATEPMVLGPGQTIFLQFGEVPFDDIPDKVNGEKLSDYVAWAKYEDTINPVPIIWQTQLSLRLNGDRERHVAFLFRTTYNCVDNDCPEKLN